MAGTDEIRRRPVGRWLGGFVAVFLVWAWIDSMSTYTNLVHWGPENDVEFFSGEGSIDLAWSRNVWIRPSIRPPFREKPGDYPIMLEFEDPPLGEPEVVEIAANENEMEIPCVLDWGYDWSWEQRGPWARPGLLIGRQPGLGMVQHRVRLPYWLLLGLWLTLWFGGRRVWQRWVRRRGSKLAPVARLERVEEAG